MGNAEAAYGPLADLISAAEIARTFNVSSHTVRDWFDRGLPRYRLGRHNWASEAELYAFIKNHLRRESGSPRTQHPTATQAQQE